MAAPRPRPAAKPRIKSKFVKPKRKADGGPDLPWPCWQVRIGSFGKTDAELRAEGKRRGIVLTHKQERQALACLGRA